jgi:hypothetical protein
VDVDMRPRVRTRKTAGTRFEDDEHSPGEVSVTATRSYAAVAASVPPLGSLVLAESGATQRVPGFHPTWPGSKWSTLPFQPPAEPQ